MVGYPIATARASDMCDAIRVSTDDEVVTKVANAKGAHVPFPRPSEFAQDLTITVVKLHQALRAYKTPAGKIFDICVFLTPTDIFRSASWVTRAVTVLKENPELESAFQRSSTHKNYWARGESDQWERILPWKGDYRSRQVCKKIYYADTGLAHAHRAQLWREDRRIGDHVEPILTICVQPSSIFIPSLTCSWLNRRSAICGSITPNGSPPNQPKF